ncbi:hypothetical protein P43SY_008689 [Pythium insidiosum]|uniref:MIF4G domain-containing protein n=1 Tax=Pythium insidiosum TaxID=114742 RepID=A0AAD5LFF6_PYTIN|nr:hypothetical protein P43SY_008689 [Pythium insidiosum]
MSKLNPNAGEFVPSFSAPAASMPAAPVASTPAPAASATPKASKAKSSTPSGTKGSGKASTAASPASTGTSNSKPSKTSEKAADPRSEPVDSPQQQSAASEADAVSDRITYSIEYLLRFQPICDAVPCHFPDVVRAPRPQRLGRYVNDRLVYTIPELLQFQTLYQMPPPNLQWTDTLAIISPPDVKAKAATKSKKEKAGKKSASATATSAQLQYDPTLMCYFNPTEYTAALNMAMNSSKDGSSSDASGRGALDSLLDDVTTESVASILQSFDEIEITCTTTLQELIGFLFDRAIAASDHCEGFAQLFSGISERTPEFKEGAKTINFRRILLTKCYEALIEESEATVTPGTTSSS